MGDVVVVNLAKLFGIVTLIVVSSIVGMWSVKFGVRLLRESEDSEWERDVRSEVERVLQRNETDLKKIVFALVLIIYRYRNNFFHGEKDLRFLEGQKDNFDVANKMIMRLLDLYKQATSS